MEYINVTTISIAIIIGVFMVFMKEIRKVYMVYKCLDKAQDNSHILDSLEQTVFNDLVLAYRNTITVGTLEGDKSNVPASEIFTEYSTCKAQKLNLKLLDTASGTLVGLGLLGTFLGLTIGINGFDSSTSDGIQNSIQGLLSGMSTAFSTSLCGMFLSLVFITVDKVLRNKLTKSVHALTERIDNDYYIDDVTLLSLRSKELLDNLSSNIKELLKEQTESIENVKTAIDSELTYSDSEGNKATVGNAIREILTENLEQTKALKSFSTDLAIELNNGFDETLSRQMQQRIVPLMENVDATTRTIVEHIDQMAVAVSSPATDMLQAVVQELKASMATIVDEFRSGLSGSATAELERLAESLGTATQAMGNFPSHMESISNTLQVTIDEVKNAISEISNTSANANSTAMRQMQEQITLATTSMGNAIEQVKEVMNGMTATSQEESNKIVGKLSDAADKMGTFLNETVSSLSSSVRETVKNMADDVSNKQADLISLQEDSLTQTKTLLETFNSGLDRLERMNEYIAGTMNQFQQAQGQITGSTANLQTITSDMKLATELFNKGQSDYANTMTSLQSNSQRGIDSIANLLRESGNLSSQYVSEFDTIKQGLVSIFAEVQKGLTEYSRTVKASTQEYLDKYSTSLTNTTDKLSSTIQQQNEVVEMLVESMNARKH